MKILMVGPALLPIPINGWGAVENVIWYQKLFLNKLGIEVDILNEKGVINAILKLPYKYDVIHLHYENFVDLWFYISKLFKTKFILTSHNAYVGYPDLWDNNYCKVFESLKKVKYIFVLSNKIKNSLRNKGFKNTINVLPNGVDTSSLIFRNQGNNRCIVLGRIERRKRQVDLSILANRLNISGIDYVGPIYDSNFLHYIDGRKQRYLGEWTRDEVYKNLTKWSCLALPSNGEAHSLAILEAMAAGLSIVCTPEASANMPMTLPWYKQVKLDFRFIKEIELTIRLNKFYRKDIREYVINRFDWTIICNKYVKIISSILKGHR